MDILKQMMFFIYPLFTYNIHTHFQESILCESQGSPEFIEYLH